MTVFGETKQSLRLSYISLPLMAKLAFGAGNSSAARPYIIAGPEAGFLLSAKTSDLKGDLKGYVPGLGGGAVDIRESGS
ncbi:MAG: PorT family protein, partial [candidate division Zixibacteria bacterium]|nr:PorT family protein [candidate division Zixibacteria bacterium]NIT53326.1 PorT family protein [candidate division Zixibacteria bacterium]NIV05543.1 outer membrane beta-barrel protein [candidate division Zixibacteria bacterium]NIX55220.1 outer membrane beta-barrel protein [candidate division Zixibacteria bacterium]NIX80114.1 outer membrane beta-barrel protein [candidate division Zixibacteria bacterium]